MRIEGSYPPPIHGVSTLSPRNRVEGQMESQINFRSDPVHKLTRRPPLKWEEELLTGVDKNDLLHHSFKRDGSVFRFILNKVSGDLLISKDGDPGFSSTTTVGAWFLGSNIIAQTVDNKTMFVNTDTVLELNSATDESVIERVSHINITTALNYSETVQVNITKSDGTRHTVAYTVRDLGTSSPNYDAADKARATKHVAQQLAARINGGGTYTSSRVASSDYPDDPYNDVDFKFYCLPYIDDPMLGPIINPDFDATNVVCLPYIGTFAGITGVTAVALGSTVAVWEDGRADWLDLEIETGQGDRSCVAINNTVEHTAGMPLYAVVGTHVIVKPNPVSDKGIYYLRAERIAEDASGEELEEVTWVESRSATEPYSIDTNTVPIIVELFGTGVFTINAMWFDERERGDNVSVPVPDFIGHTITNIGYFHKRLALLSENNVILSEADEDVNFWKQSAIQLLVSDTVSVASSAVGIDKLKYIVPHNRDLLIFASNSQFKIAGETSITPETTSMVLTTSYECQTSVAPVSLGNSVFFAIDYGSSTGLQEYTGERNTSQDVAKPLSHHIIGYMPGKPKLMVASANLEMVAIVTDGSAGNKLFIYEQYTDDSGKRRQRSWCEWVIPASNDIIDIEFRKDNLTLIVSDGDSIVRKSLNMYSRVNTGADKVYLDDMLELSTDGLTATLPVGYNATDVIAIRGDGTLYQYNKAEFTLSGSTLTFDENIGAGYVYVGKLYRSAVIPTRPFKYDEEGKAITSDRLRIAKFILSVVDTHEVNMRVVSDYYNVDDTTFNSRYVGGINNVLGEVPFHTGSVPLSFSQDADLASPEFYCDDWLGCTISDISWVGQYYKSSRRM